MVLYNQKPMLESIDEASCLSVDLINFRSDFMYAVHLSAVVLGYGLFYSNTIYLLIQQSIIPSVDSALIICKRKAAAYLPNHV